MLEVRDLTKYYGSLVGRKKFTAVDHVSFSLEKGKTVGFAGKSGCGKSTVARMVLQLISSDGGQVLFHGTDLTKLSQRQLIPWRKKMQIVFQNPEGSLDPSRKVLDSLMSPLIVHKCGNKDQRMEQIEKTAALTYLSTELFSRYPHQLSGGEAQRVVLCRALLLQPELLVLDEATSMLDVSVQAQIMNLLKEIRQQLNLTCIFIGHDLDVLRWFCDDLIVMHQGKIIERGPVEAVLEDPKEERTRAMVDAFYNWE